MNAGWEKLKALIENSVAVDFAKAQAKAQAAS